MSVALDLATREARALMPTYSRYPVTFVRGEGVRLFDDEGTEYLDFAAGIAVAQIGHSHPRWVAAVTDQAARLAHVSNLFYTEPQVELAERLVELAGWGRVFLANSGAEANEAALKIAKKSTGRAKIVSALGGFHGRTIATLAATGYPEKHAPFEPLPSEFVHVPFGDTEALGAAVDEETAAVILEPVLGEGGVVPAPEGYLEAARAACDAAGSLLILDEVQTGIGRCGDWFAHTESGVRPDVMTLAKGLAGGLPIGVCIARDAIGFGPGDHASTFGGGPVPCAAALAVLEVIEQEDLLANARARGEQLLRGLGEAVAGSKDVQDIRGRGMLVGVELSKGAIPRPVVQRALRGGLVLTESARHVVRFSPPLTVTEADVALAIERFAEALHTVEDADEGAER
ncbi:MAG: acetylornithine transaminase [Actinomycetota bacterium]